MIVNLNNFIEKIKKSKYKNSCDFIFTTMNYIIKKDLSTSIKKKLLYDICVNIVKENMQSNDPIIINLYILLSNNIIYEVIDIAFDTYLNINNIMDYEYSI
jgi:hypothetical protein